MRKPRGCGSLVSRGTLLLACSLLPLLFFIPQPGEAATPHLTITNIGSSSPVGCSSVTGATGSAVNGTTFGHEVKVSNIGSADATGVTVSDQAPGGETYGKALLTASSGVTGNLTQVSDGWRWANGKIPLGGTLTVVWNVTLDVSSSAGSTVTNLASIDSPPSSSTFVVTGSPAACGTMVPLASTLLSSSTITVGDSVTDAAILTGVSDGVKPPNIPAASGTMTFTVFSGPGCTNPVAGQTHTVSSPFTANGANGFNAMVTISGLQAGTYGVGAIFSGDANNAAATSPCELLNVNKTAPSIATNLLSSTITVDGSDIDSATIAGATSTAVGTVQYEYFLGGSCQGTVFPVGFPVAVMGGVVPFSASQQFGAAGTYSWKAVYSGDANNRGATSGCEPLAVLQRAVSVTTTLSSTSITIGGVVTDTATLSGATFAAGGTLTYYYFSGGICSGTATQVGSPVTVVNGIVPASALLQFSSPGAYGWNAVYGGDSNNAGATSKCEPLTVLKITSSITPALSATAVVAGRPVTDAAIVSNGYQAGGTAQYEYFGGNSCAGTATTVGSPVKVTDNVIPPSSPQIFVVVGTYSWNIVYSGDANNNAATSPCQALAVNRDGVSVEAELSGTKVAYGTGVTDSASLINATAKAGGTVTYSVFSAGYCSGTVLASETVPVANATVLTSDTLVFSSPGSYSWNAAYGGDSANNPATSPCEPLTVTGLAVTAVTISCQSSKLVVGAATSCKATVNTFGPAVSGTVSWSSSISGKFSSTSCTFARSTLTGPSTQGLNHYGFCSVTFTPSATGYPVQLLAAYGGDLQNAASNGTSSLTVSLRATTTVVSCAPRTAVAGSGTLITCSAKVTGFTPTGGMTWAQSGSGTVLFGQSSCQLTSGSCSVSLKGNTAGAVKLKVVYGGDPNNKGSSRVATVTIAKAPTQVAISCVPPSPAVGSAMQCTVKMSGLYSSQTGTVIWAKISGTGGVKFSSSACTLVSGECSITVNVTRKGTFTIRATYRGDSNNLRSSGTISGQFSA